MNTNKSSKRTHNLFSTCLIAAALFSISASADNAKGFYVGLGGASVENQFDSISSSRPTFLEISGGYKYNNALGVELRIGSALNPGKASNYVSADSPSTFNNMERDISSIQSIYYRPELVNEEARLYGLIGYTRLTSQFRLLDNQGGELSSTDQSFSGFSYGIGVGFILSDELNLNFEARTLCKALDKKQNSIGVSLDYRF